MSLSQNINISQQHFCNFLSGKNAAFLRILDTRSLAEEYSNDSSSNNAGNGGSDGSGSTAVTQTAAEVLAPVLEDTMDESDNAAVFYLMLRAVERFRGEFNRYPGVYANQVDGDIPKLKVCGQ